MSNKKNFRLPGCFVKTSKVDDVILCESTLRKIYKSCGVPENMIPSSIVKIRKVVYDNPNTVVVWDDDTVTKCLCSEYDKYDEEKGLLICILKKICGSQEVIDVFNSWVPEPSIISELEGRKEVTLKDVRKKIKGE